MHISSNPGQLVAYANALSVTFCLPSHQSACPRYFFQRAGPPGGASVRCRSAKRPTLSAVRPTTANSPFVVVGDPNKCCDLTKIFAIACAGLFVVHRHALNELAGVLTYGSEAPPVGTPSESHHVMVHARVRWRASRRCGKGGALSMLTTIACRSLDSQTPRRGFCNCCTRACCLGSLCNPSVCTVRRTHQRCVYWALTFSAGPMGSMRAIFRSLTHSAAPPCIGLTKRPGFCGAISSRCAGTRTHRWRRRAKHAPRSCTRSLRELRQGFGGS